MKTIFNKQISMKKTSNNINPKIIDKNIKRIKELNLVFEAFKDNFESINKENLKKIEFFKSKYENFVNIKRFSIPVIGKINSGKSTFLNYLLDLNDILECSESITTKFICLIRHNEKLKNNQPQFFEVKLEERFKIGENNILWNFNKGKEIKGDIKQIIKEKNKFLSDKSQIKNPDHYFYILESYIPFFENLNEISSYFEFIDVPGLNEISIFSDKENIYIDKIIPIFVKNVCFSIFIFDSENYHDENNSKNIFFSYKN